MHGISGQSGNTDRFLGPVHQLIPPALQLKSNDFGGFMPVLLGLWTGDLGLHGLPFLFLFLEAGGARMDKNQWKIRFTKYLQRSEIFVSSSGVGSSQFLFWHPSLPVLLRYEKGYCIKWKYIRPLSILTKWLQANLQIVNLCIYSIYKWNDCSWRKALSNNNIIEWTEYLDMDKKIWIILHPFLPSLSRWTIEFFIVLTPLTKWFIFS